MPYRRNFTRRRSRKSNLVTIQSYKQISVDGPASRAAATNIVHVLASGVDNYTGPSASNNEVPTGAVIKFITIFATFTNLVSVSSLLHLNIMLTHSGQTVLTPGAIGGTSARNQVYHTMMKFLGKEQNSNFIINFRIPQGVQRMREGDKWNLMYRSDTVFASATQAIYKFYR